MTFTLTPASELLSKVNTEEGYKKRLFDIWPVNIQEAMKLLEKEQSQKSIKDAIKFSSVLVRAKVPEQLMRRILRLHPVAHAYLIGNGVGNLSVRDAVADAVAYAFLGCAWYRGEVKAERDAFLSLIEEQAANFGLAPTGGALFKKQLLNVRGVERIAECMRTGESPHILLSQLAQ